MLFTQRLAISMKSIITILASLILTPAFGQKQTEKHCFTNNNPKTKITRQHYPFNRAKRILLVTGDQGRSNLFISDSAQLIVPKKANRIDTTRFIAKHQLTDNGIDSLIKIINQRDKDDLIMEPFCTEPYNAILFIDKEGNIFEYIALCFRNSGKNIDYSEVGPPAVNLGSWCSNKGTMLADFFQRRSIKTIIKDW